MKPLVIIGILFVLLGVVALSYESITYTKEEKIAEIGPFKATAEREKSIPLPPLLGGLALAAGAIMIAVGYRK
jgi:ABC-type phosphate transport system permease subunit